VCVCVCLCWLFVIRSDLLLCSSAGALVVDSPTSAQQRRHVQSIARPAPNSVDTCSSRVFKLAYCTCMVVNRDTALLPFGLVCQLLLGFWQVSSDSSSGPSALEVALQRFYLHLDPSQRQKVVTSECCSIYDGHVLQTARFAFGVCSIYLHIVRKLMAVATQGCSKLLAFLPGCLAFLPGSHFRSLQLLF
jgi:hypothetical protein